MVQQALQDDFVLTPGGLIELSRLSDKIGNNPKLMDDYRAMAPSLKGSTSTATLHDNLKRILDGMSGDGYLMLRNPEREIYMVTGKITYLHQVCAFLLDHEATVEHSEVDPQMDFPHSINVIPTVTDLEPTHEAPDGPIV